MRKIKLTESDITKIIRKTIETKLNEDKFSVEPEVPRRPREMEIDRLFGKYTYHVPDDVIRYMRKNPALIIKRLLDIYGEDKLMKYVDMARNPKEMEMRLDNDSLRDELGESDEDGDWRSKIQDRIKGEKQRPTSPLYSLFSAEDNNELEESDVDTNKDNKVSKDELYKHFDSNKDGKVTRKEYAKHIKHHQDNPDLLDKYDKPVKEMVNRILSRLS